MHHDDQIRAITAAIAFGFMLAGHHFGDQWAQTARQACMKGLDAGYGWACAMWHCAKHVATWTATTTAFFAGAAWWLHLPLRPGWLAAGVALNMVTHFVIDLRTPLIWLARALGRGGYIDHVQVVRPSGAERTGPGTALFHLDYAAHIVILAAASLLIAGPA